VSVSIEQLRDTVYRGIEWHVTHGVSRNINYMQIFVGFHRGVGVKYSKFKLLLEHGPDNPWRLIETRRLSEHWPSVPRVYYSYLFQVYVSLTLHVNFEHLHQSV